MFAINGGELSKPAYYRFMTKPNRSFKHGAANVPVETTLIRVLDYNPEKSDLDFRPQAMIVNVQVEPYLHSGMGQVSFHKEALKFFFSWGVDFKR